MSRGFSVTDNILKNRLDTFTLNDNIDVNITGPLIGNALQYSTGDWKNISGNSGVIKVNSFNTNLSSNNVLTFTNLTTEQIVEYRKVGETTTTLNISAFPTSSPPQNINNGTFTNPDDFYFIGATPGDDRFIQNQLEGQAVLYRFTGSYSSKPSGNAGRIQIRQFNPLSSFTIGQCIPLSAGITSDTFTCNLISFNDSANIPTGYQFGVSSTTSLNLTITSISRIDLPYNTRV